MMVLLAVIAVFIATGVTMIPATNESIAYGTPFPITGCLTAFIVYSLVVTAGCLLFRDVRANKPK